MKKILQNYKTGEIEIAEVPVPAVKKGYILVKNLYSAVSVGTERAKVELARKNILQKVMERKDDLKKFWMMVKREGFLSAYRKAKTILETPRPLGYSCCGKVVEISEGIDDIRVGDIVACAGDDAHHAEFVCCNRALCVKVPHEVLPEESAFVALGSIAINAVRKAEAQIGDKICVIGLGLIGLIITQILKSAGCKVYGIDVNEKRIELAKKFGAEVSNKIDFEKIKDFTEGVGFDSVILSLSTSEEDIMDKAGKIARDRGKIIIVGVFPIQIPRDIYYYKDLEVRIVRSYGPGRYDPIYEEKSIDYPVGYVRWTENRNMKEFIELLKNKEITLKPLITHIFPIEKAKDAYQLIREKKEEFVGVLFKYPEEEKVIRVIEKKREYKGEKVNLGVIGAGKFCQSNLLPHLKEKVYFKAVCNEHPESSFYVQKKFGFERATTNPEDIINDEEINAVLIATRHDTHAELIKKSLLKDKYVFCEKPLAIKVEDVFEIKKIVEKGGGRLQIGFNRRFSPSVVEAKKEMGDGIFLINYRVNAGEIDKNHWVQDLDVGGGRIIGEVCHFVDTLIYLLSDRPVEVFAYSTPDSVNFDNAIINLKFGRGSIANVIYASKGDKYFEKERIEIFGKGKVIIIEDFKRLRISKEGVERVKELKGKGFKEELRAFIDAVEKGKPSPISFEDIFYTSLTTFAIIESIKKNSPKNIR